jgi:hypothetical protein
MGISDTPPGHVPNWVMPASTALLGLGVFFWGVTYILITRHKPPDALVRHADTGTDAQHQLGDGLRFLRRRDGAGEVRVHSLAAALPGAGIHHRPARPRRLVKHEPMGRQPHVRVLASMALAGCWGHYAFVLVALDAGHGVWRQEGQVVARRGGIRSDRAGILVGCVA